MNATKKSTWLPLFAWGLKEHAPDDLPPIIGSLGLDHHDGGGHLLEGGHEIGLELARQLARFERRGLCRVRLQGREGDDCRSNPPCSV